MKQFRLSFGILNKLLTQSTLEIRVYQRAGILLLKSEGASNEAMLTNLILESVW